MGDVDVPGERPLDLSPQLTEDLAVIGMLPEIFQRARETAFTGLQRRGVRDRAPPVARVLGVQGEVDADVVAR